MIGGSIEGCFYCLFVCFLAQLMETQDKLSKKDGELSNKNSESEQKVRPDSLLANICMFIIGGRGEGNVSVLFN